MNWNDLTHLMYAHPLATFFFLLAIAGIVKAVNPFPVIKHEHIHTNAKGAVWDNPTTEEDE